MCIRDRAQGALAFYPVLGFLAVRFILRFAVLLPALLRTAGQPRHDALRIGLPLGTLMLGIFLCETFGVAHTQASNAAFLISLCVVFTPFVEWWLLGSRPAQGMFVFAGISLLGAALLSGGLVGEFGLGDGLMLAAAVMRAITAVSYTNLDVYKRQSWQCPAIAKRLQVAPHCGWPHSARLL